MSYKLDITGLATAAVAVAAACARRSKVVVKVKHVGEQASGRSFFQVCHRGRRRRGPSFGASAGRFEFVGDLGGAVHAQDPREPQKEYEPDLEWRRKQDSDFSSSSACSIIIFNIHHQILIIPFFSIIIIFEPIILLPFKIIVFASVLLTVLLIGEANRGHYFGLTTK